jgi:hypothetical protein
MDLPVGSDDGCYVFCYVRKSLFERIGRHETENYEMEIACTIAAWKST